MLSTIQSQIKELSRKFPNWDQEVTQFFEEDDADDITPNTKILDAFTEILSQLLEYSKTGEISNEEAIAAFDGFVCKNYVSKYIKIKLRTYESYKPLRDLAAQDIYKAKYCVDVIWSSYILRFNPRLTFDENIPLNEESFKIVAMQLDRFTDYCVDRGYHIDAISYELKNNAGFSDVLCDYIAGKIDESFEKLKLNVILHRLSMCEQAIDTLSEE